MRVGGVLERTVELFAAIAIDPPQVLQAEPHRRERVLDLVRDLPGHLTPGQHPLRARHVGHVVEGDDDAEHLGAQRSQLKRDPAAVGLELPGGLGVRIGAGSGAPRR